MPKPRNNGPHTLLMHIRRERTDIGNGKKLYELPMKANNRLSWTVPSEALLRGLSSLKLGNTNGKYNKQAERYKLIVSETTWLLWKCRNERVIYPKEMQPSQVKSRWVAEMNNRIKIKYIKILKSKGEDKPKSIKSFKEGWLENGAIAELENGKLTMK